MPALVLLGAQWGDEGKGKATDLLVIALITLSAIKVVTMPATQLLSVIKSTHCTYFLPESFLLT